jgi:hypothetical protein
MDADLDLLLIYVFCIADDLLPTKSVNHRRSLTDAQVVTLAVAQSIMGIPSDLRGMRDRVDGQRRQHRLREVLEQRREEQHRDENQHRHHERRELRARRHRR